LPPTFKPVSFLAYSSTLKMEATCSLEASVDSIGLHGAISQKLESFAWVIALNDKIIRSDYLVNMLSEVIVTVEVTSTLLYKRLFFYGSLYGAVSALTI
jgi:hypothetical protein